MRPLLPNLCTDQSYRRLILFSAYHGSKGEGKNALHGHAILIDRMRDRLVTPSRSTVFRVRAQIISLYNDASERALKRARVWILV
jgi:hypothetical protein